jgi:membrane protease YdiL (CAAX protease family)
LLVGLRNNRWDEWKAWVLTVIVFSLMHLVNVFGGDFLTVLIIVVPGGTLWYVSRRVFNNLFVSIGLHALYDTAFFLLPGKYLVNESLPDQVLDIQLGSFLILLAASILFVIFGRGLFKEETTGW